MVVLGQQFHGLGYPEGREPLSEANTSLAAKEVREGRSLHPGDLSGVSKKDALRVILLDILPDPVESRIVGESGFVDAK